MFTKIFSIVFFLYKKEKLIQNKIFHSLLHQMINIFSFFPLEKKAIIVFHVIFQCLLCFNLFRKIYKWRIKMKHLYIFLRVSIYESSKYHSVNYESIFLKIIYSFKIYNKLKLVRILN